MDTQHLPAEALVLHQQDPCTSFCVESGPCCCRTVAEVVPGVLQDFRPDLVLYDAGVDPHHDDKLGRLKLTDNGLMRREMQVGLTVLSLSPSSPACVVFLLNSG